MGTKLQPGQFDGYSKALCDEPMFTLLARDPDAPILVELWAHMRDLRAHLRTDTKEQLAKVAEARQCATSMREFYKTRAWEYERREITKREVDAAAHRHLVNRLREQLTKVHTENIGMALHVRLEAMFTWIDVACPKDLVLDAGKIVAEIIAHKAWEDGEEMGRSIKEGLKERADELLAANNALINDKRKMYEPVTEGEVQVCWEAAQTALGFAKGTIAPSIKKKYSAALNKLVQLRSAKTTYDNREQRPTRVEPALGMSYGKSVPPQGYPRILSHDPTDREISEAIIAAMRANGRESEEIRDIQKVYFGAALRDFLNRRRAQVDDDFED